MSNPSLIAQIFARDPRKLVRLPELTVEPAIAELQQLQEQLAAQVAPVAAAMPASEAVTVAPAALPESFKSSLCALVTHVWRAKLKLVDTTTGEPKEETRRAYRHVEAALETFTQMELTMSDWIDQPYDPGLPVKVLTFQPMSGLMRDTVVEAVRPTIIWKDQLLQLGEVVVGIPAQTEEPH